MATALIAPFITTFGELAGEHGDVMLAEQLVAFLVDGPWAVTSGKDSDPAPRRLQPRVLIRDRLLQLWREHGSDVARAQMRQALLGYVLVGARASRQKREAAAEGVER